MLQVIRHTIISPVPDYSIVVETLFENLYDLEYRLYRIESYFIKDGKSSILESRKNVSVALLGLHDDMVTQWTQMS